MDRAAASGAASAGSSPAGRASYVGQLCVTKDIERPPPRHTYHNSGDTGWHRSMPELPEVETIRRDLQRGILNKIIKRVHIFDSRILRQPAKEISQKLSGCAIEAVVRRGKALALELSSGEHWIVQVMMTGQLILNGPRGRHTRLALDFTDGDCLLYNDQRVFGQLRVVADFQDVPYFRILGPEPFDDAFNDAYIAAYLKKTKRPIKNVLLDPGFVAGIGNIYASEILFQCRISPKRRGHRIKLSEAALLHQHTNAVLKQAIAMRGSSMRNYLDGAGKKGKFNQRLKVYARAGKPCAHCGSPIERIVQAGRSTFYCMKCQI